MLQDSMDAGARDASREWLTVLSLCRWEGRILVPIVVSGRERRGEAMRDGLSKREQAVLSWLQHGLSNKEIGVALSISPRTVQKHLQRVYQNLGVQTRAEAIVRIHRRARYSRV